MKRVVHGVVFDGVFYSTRMQRVLSAETPHGIYTIDPAADPIESGLEPANLHDAIAYFRHSSTMEVLRGIAFHKGIIPEQPVRYSKLPIAVIGGQFDEWEIIDAVAVRKKFLYYLQSVTTPDVYVIEDLKRHIESGSVDALTIKHMTPAMRVAHGFHLLEKRRLEQKKPMNIIKSSMQAAGAVVQKARMLSSGFEVVWTMAGHTINTRLTRDLRVLEAGFCVSGYDSTQSARSLPRLLQTYVDAGDRIHKTRA